MVGVALELSVIIGWPIRGGGRGQGPPVDQSGAGGRKATSVPYSQTPVGYAHGRNDKWKPVQNEHDYFILPAACIARNASANILN